MKNDAPLTPLPPDLEALLDDERQRPGLTEAAKDRIFARLQTPPPSPPRGKFPTAIGSFIIGLLVGGALASALWIGRFAAPQPRLLMLDSPPPPPALIITIPAANIPPSLTPQAAQPTQSSTRRSHADRGAPSASATPAPDDRDTDLARERALIETARTALSHKQSDSVDLLARHAQQFPRGRLAEERESLLIQALLVAGRIDEARRRGEKFRVRWPRSLLLPVVEAALRSIP